MPYAPQPLSMFQNTQDILNIALAGGFIILVIFLSVTLMYCILVLHDVKHITKTARTTTDQVSHYILKPISLISKLAMNLKPIVELIGERLRQRMKKKTKK